MWHVLARLILWYRVVLLALLSSATAFMAYQARKVQISYEFTRTIPTDNPKYREFQEARRLFGDDGNVLVIGIQCADFFNDAYFRDYTALAQHIEQVPAVQSVLSICAQSDTGYSYGQAQRHPAI